MTTACIIQARLGSTRLPAKVLLPLPTGRMVIEEVVFRCRQIKGVDVVVAAVSEDDGSDIVARVAASAGAHVVRGPERDVLKRYKIAAECVCASVVMRVTSDCPLVDPAVCAEVLAVQQANRGYVSNTLPRTWPQGYDCEAFDMSLLHLADQQAESAYDREHVTPWMQKQLICLGPNVKKPGEPQGFIRLTLDTPEDYVAIWNEFDRRLRTPSVPGHPVEAHAGA